MTAIGVTIYVIDRRYSSGWQDPTRHLFPIVWVGPSATMESIVTNITATARHYGLGYCSIELIRLAAHGNSGYLQLGEGLTINNVSAFRRLRPWMVPGMQRVGVEIHGCGVASETSITAPGGTITNPVCVPGQATNSIGAGRMFLRALATAVRRPVTGGINCQYSDRAWTYEGPTMMEYPNIDLNYSFDGSY